MIGTLFFNLCRCISCSFFMLGDVQVVANILYVYCNILLVKITNYSIELKVTCSNTNSIGQHYSPYTLSCLCCTQTECVARRHLILSRWRRRRRCRRVFTVHLHRAYLSVYFLKRSHASLRSVVHATSSTFAPSRYR